MVEYKAVTLPLKALDAAGSGQAVIATCGQIDHDLDVTLKGAFGSQVVPMLPAHRWDHIPLGKATLHEENDLVLADFQLNLDLPEGKAWHSALAFDLAHPPARQEWSYGFQVLESDTGDFEGKQVRFLRKVRAMEISPVVAGAGVGTRTLSVKDLKQDGWEVQSLIFPKDRWDSTAAVRTWLREHDFATELDETESSYRARQKDPGAFSRLRTICLAPSRDTPMGQCRVQAVGGPPKGLEPEGLKLDEEMEDTCLRLTHLMARLEAFKQFRLDGAEQQHRRGRILSQARVNALQELQGRLTSLLALEPTVDPEELRQNVQLLQSFDGLLLR